MSTKLKEYICICGKEFNSSQAFNSHRASCKEYLISVNKYTTVKNKLHEAGKKGGKLAAETHKKLKQERINK